MNRLIIFFIAVICIGLSTIAMGAVPSYVPTQGLIGWWPFSGNVNDESENKNNGEAIGASLSQDRFGNLSKAYAFDGVDDYISIPSSNSLYPPKGISIALWCKISKNLTESYIPIIGKPTDQNVGYFSFDISTGDAEINNSGSVSFGLETEGDSYTWLGDRPINLLDEWIHVVGTYDGNKVKLFENGILVMEQEKSGDILYSESDVEIGRLILFDVLGTKISHFIGSIDDIGMWDRALSQREISDLFSATESSSSQQSALNLRLIDKKWLLDYQPSPLKGSILLHSSPELIDLFSTSVDIIDVPSNSGLLSFDVSKFADGEKKFFAITEKSGVSASDWNYNIPDEIIEEEYLYDLTTITAISYPLKTGTETTVHFNIVDSITGEIALINGSVELELLTASGDPVGFPYTLSPSSLPVRNGVVNGMVIIETTDPLDAVYISVKDIRDLPGKRSTRSTENSKKPKNKVVGITVQILDERYQLSRGWNNPLGASRPLVGSFGEWRPTDPKPGGAPITSNQPGRPHGGVDLAQVKGKPVYPVKSGVVSKHGCVGKNSGNYMFVVHGDGTASAYLHVKPIKQVGEAVNIGDTIATISDIDAPHLHLELFEGVKLDTRPGEYKNWHRQGTSFNPIQPDVKFDIPLMLSDTDGPEIKGIYFWRTNLDFWKIDPVSTFSDRQGPQPPPDLLANKNGLIVAQIVDPEKGYVLAPYKVEFFAEKASKQEFDTDEQKLQTQMTFLFKKLSEIRKLFAGYSPSPNFGYTQRKNNQINKEAKYEYWFKWNTSVYAEHPLGERTFRIVATDHANQPRKLDFTIGPKITFPNTVCVDEGPQGSVFDVEVENFFGPFPSGMGTPKDTVKFSLLSESLKRWEVFFVGPTNLEQELGHKDKHSFTIGVRFKDPLAPSLQEKFKIRAESGIYPDIAHEIEVNIPTLSASDSFALIPAGSFEMGDTLGEGSSNERPVRTVYVSAFLMGKREVTKAEWDEVRTWGLTRGYTDLFIGAGAASDHPVVDVSWCDVIKWSNARSEKDCLAPVYMVNGAVMRTGTAQPTANWAANGYRLPTEAEWEKAARGGLNGKRFPWGDTITHSQANYYSNSNLFYDISLTPSHHPTYAVSRTSPVGSFAANGYGLYDMTGNVFEWCWDWYGDYDTGSPSDPRGASSGSFRVYRGGSWFTGGRVADRGKASPWGRYGTFGFRSAR